MESTPRAAVPMPTDIHEVSVKIRKEVGKNFELDVTVTLPSGITILFGASGAGKTTLLDCIAGLVRPEEGRIGTQEKILFESALGINISPQFRRVGYVFQDLALFPHLTVQGNVEYGLLRLATPGPPGGSGALLKSFPPAHLRS